MLASWIIGTPQTAKADRVFPVLIAPSDYGPESDWNQYGPAFEANPNAKIRGHRPTHSHAFGRSEGRLSYSFELDSLPELVAVYVSARMSAEVPGYSGRPSEVSDVSLIVNGDTYRSQTVKRDNGSGQRYKWQIHPSSLRIGANALSFSVLPSATNKNGLCIYFRPLRGDGEPEYIRIDTGPIARMDVSAGPLAFTDGESLQLTVGQDAQGRDFNSNIDLAFSAARSFDPDGDPISSYQWDIGGQRARGEFVELRRGRGSYPLGLTVESETAVSTASAHLEIVGRKGESALGLSWPFLAVQGWNSTGGYGTGDCGTPSGGDHCGDDWFAQDWNWTPPGVTDRNKVLLSPADGTIIFSGRGVIGGYGNQVVILLSNAPFQDFALRLTHLQQLWVSTGQSVCAGTPIGVVGDVGSPGQVHLHAVAYMGVLQKPGPNRPNGYTRLLQGDSLESLSSRTSGPTRFALSFTFDPSSRPQGCAGDGFAVEGSVRRGEARFAGVRVALKDLSGTELQEFTTADSGNFAFNEVLPGTYSVEPTAPGCTFAPPELTFVVVDGHRDLESNPGPIVPSC